MEILFEELALSSLEWEPQKWPPHLTSDEALQIARLDAERAYRNLTPDRITLALDADG